ncbi:hypothetical protein NKJ72_21375 [Mesorhizobium sp. M0045]|uniref:hypothetical protein n=1 Tax=unclassified Mesorhizobium TaxID=325217 RepID=UPI0033369AA0
MDIAPTSLRGLMLDEAANADATMQRLGAELVLLDRMDRTFADFLSRRPDAMEGEGKYFVLASLARIQILKSCANYVRLHIGDAYSASRLAADAAFYATMISLGHMSEEEYQRDFRKRNSLAKSIRRKIDSGEDFPPIVAALLFVTKEHSAHAHADPISLANRTRCDEQGVTISFFQDIEDDKDLKYLFMGMLWVGSMCLKAFVDIAARDFGEDVSGFLARLEAWKADILAHRRAIGIFRDVPDGAGF